MATFVSTIQLTDQGMKDIRSTCQRAEEFKSKAAAMGVEVQGLYWTTGSVDGLVIFTANDDQAATAAMLHLGSTGNVKTQTSRAYLADEMQAILGAMPS